MSFWLVALLGGCGETATQTPTQAPSTPKETVEATQPEEMTEATTPAEQLPEANVDPAYAQQIGDFYATLSQEEKATVGFGYVDLDQDGQNELIIGEISPEDPLSVAQGIICVATDSRETKWYMTYDLDGDVSNDDPTDEAAAKSILEINQKHYVAAEYQPYTMYR